MTIVSVEARRISLVVGRASRVKGGVRASRVPLLPICWTISISNISTKILWSPSEDFGNGYKR